MALLGGFSDRALSADHLNPENFSDFGNRKLRYDILWAMYENTAYSNIHSWALAFKTKFAIYQYARSVYSPCYRIAEFYKTHLWGGRLDPNAGDGSEEPSALPIDVERAGVRKAIASIFKWSNWATQKDVVALRGAALGDTFLRVMIAPEYERVYIEPVDPAVVKSVSVDAWGNIKAYEIEYETKHPLTSSTAVYSEKCERDGDYVVWRTFLNGQPFDWGNGASMWSEPYGFIPMVHIQHNDVGVGWGWSEIHPAFSRIREVDDLASMLTDQVRKIINDTGWAITGTAKPAGVLTPVSYTTRRAQEDTDVGFPQVGREQLNVKYLTNKDARVEPMVLDLDVEGYLAHMNGILNDVERDYPELRFDNLRSSGTVSGAALRTARQPAESKVLQRRANYDAGLVGALQMAISVGAYHGFDGFGNFDLDSYDNGVLDFSIGERPIFRSGDYEDLEDQEMFWKVAKTAEDAGIPLPIYLRRAGWSEEDILEVEDAISQRRETSLRIAQGQMDTLESPQNGRERQETPSGA